MDRRSDGDGAAAERLSGAAGMDQRSEGDGAAAEWLSGELRVRSFAKINLGLEITGRRDDGYHEIVSVMQAVSLADTLIFTPTDEITVDSGVAGLDQRDDLIWKAATALRDAAGIERGVHIRAEKEIPSRAGLGGGSSNCAATLLALNEIWELGLPREELAGLAGRLGSDPAFFLYGGTALTRGRGEIVEPLPDAPRRWVVLAKPEESLSTPAVYAELRTEEHADGSATLALAAGLREGRLQYGLMRNDLAPAALRLCPAMRGVLDELEESSDFAMVSGSGSACFGLFEDEAAARATADRFTTGFLLMPTSQSRTLRFTTAGQ